MWEETGNIDIPYYTADPSNVASLSIGEVTGAALGGNGATT